ncbi:hypothetical protein VaNZ11_012763, partial [Volvox africanus]
MIVIAYYVAAFPYPGPTRPLGSLATTLILMDKQHAVTATRRQDSDVLVVLAALPHGNAELHGRCVSYMLQTSALLNTVRVDLLYITQRNVPNGHPLLLEFLAASCQRINNGNIIYLVRYP